MTATELACFSSISYLSLQSSFCRATDRGGVAVYINNKFQCKPVDLSRFCEAQQGEFAGVMIEEYSLLVIALYRSPLGDIKRFFHLLESCLGFLLTLKLSVIIGTDHNVNLNKSSPEASDFLNLIRSFNMYASIIEPTRNTSSLDTFITNLDSWNYKAIVSQEQISDHKHVLLSVKCSSRIDRSVNGRDAQTVNYRVFNGKNSQNFCETVSNLTKSWYDNIVHLPAEDAFSHFFLNFKNTFDVCFPVLSKKIRVTENSNRPGKIRPSKWYTPELAVLKNFILLVNGNAKRKPELIPMLQRLRKEYRLKLRQAKITATADAISKSANPCKTAWNFINSSKAESCVPDLGFAKADNFNKYFLDSVDALVNGCTGNTVNAIDNVPIINGCFVWKPVLEKDVVNIVYSFKASKSKDIYDMTVDVLKSVIWVIAPILAFLVNNCLASGVFPNILGKSRTVPVYKKGPRDSVSSYRPISIVPVFAKVFEAIILLQLYEYFEVHRLLVPAQYGFRKGRSTVSAVDCLLQEILKAFEGKMHTSVLCCDLSRAFDCISHKILLSKLERYGVRGGALKVLISYLHLRQQVVSWNGKNSTLMFVKHGVPQGSMLGPFLFVVAINDLYHSVLGNAILYADDTTLFASHTDYATAITTARSLLETASNWFKDNKLVLNESKTQEITFSLKNDVHVNSVKLLGFNLDSKLVWDDHVNMLCIRLSRVLYLLRRLKNELPVDFVKLAYYAFFHSHLTYGIRLWGHSSGTYRLLLLQKRAIRIISGAGWLEHCRPLFCMNQIFTVYSLYIFYCLLEIKNVEPNLIRNQHVHGYLTRNSSNLFINRYRLSKTINCYPVTGIRYFNALPHEVRSLPKTKFAQVVRSWLLDHPLYSLGEFEEVDYSQIIDYL